MTAHRYVIGFGFERDRAHKLTGWKQHEVEDKIESCAHAQGLAAYSLRFGPGSWTDGTGERITEQGGTVEFIGPDDWQTAQQAANFARAVRDILKQECVLYYAHPVSQFSFI